jgi:LysM repeat protein
MTRETKIGLLVGLAFIIVIGILLSDHLTSTTEPASAPLAIVGATGRDGLTTIGRPSVPVTVEPPAPVAPRTPVVTMEEMREPANVNAVIKMAPVTQHGRALPAQAVAPVAPAQPATPFAADSLVQFAEKLPQDLEVVGPAAATGGATPVTTVTVTTTIPPASEGFTEYTVKEGDSLGQIAGRLMGSSNQANQAAILKANPSMKGDPNRIIVGKSYRIPTVGVVTTATTATVAQGTVATTEVKKATDAKPAAADAGTYWYKVPPTNSATATPGRPSRN